MSHLFHPDSPVIRFLWKAADLIALNLVWLVCCIPIITIGPSTAAMYCVVRKIARGEWPAIFKTFFQAFKENFKQSLLVFLVLLIPICLVAVYLLLSVSGALDGVVLIKYLCYLGIVIIGCICTYAYPLIAHFDNSVGNTLKNAVLLPLANPFLALIATALNLLPVLIMLINFELFVTVSFFWLVIGYALTALANTKMLGWLFDRFTPDEPPAEDPLS